MKRWLVAAVAALSVGSASAQVVTGQKALEQKHRAWTSFLLTVGNVTEPRVSSSALEGVVILAMDFSPPECSVVVSFLLDLGTPTKNDNVRKDVVISLRADSGKRFDLPAYSVVTMGDDTGIVYLNETPQFSEIISELKRGASLRTKIAFGGDESSALYSTFSLSGFTAAYDRSTDLCERPAEVMNRRNREAPRDRL